MAKIKMALSFAEMELSGLKVEDVLVRSFYQCNCLIKEFNRVVDGEVLKTWFSDGGCRDEVVEVWPWAAQKVLFARLEEAEKTLAVFAAEEAKGRVYGARSSGPKYKAEANQGYAIKALDAIDPDLYPARQRELEKSLKEELERMTARYAALQDALLKAS